MAISDENSFDYAQRFHYDESLSRKVEVQNLRTGDLVDLEGDEYATTDAVTGEDVEQPLAEFELFEVLDVTRVNSDAVLVDFNGTSVTFPKGHELPRPRRADRAAPGEWEGPHLIFSDLSDMRGSDQMTVRWYNDTVNQGDDTEHNGVGVELYTDGDEWTVVYCDEDNYFTKPGYFAHENPGRALEYAERMMEALPETDGDSGSYPDYEDPPAPQPRPLDQGDTDSPPLM